MITILFRKVLTIAVTFLLVTSCLYALAMTAPPETRATLYMPRTKNSSITDPRSPRTIEITIERYGLNDPFLVQYGRWLGMLLRGNLGFSPAAHAFVLDFLLARIPATAELIIYSLVVFIPMGILSGMVAGSTRGRKTDWLVRMGTYLAAALPPFILALVLLSIFWVGLKWFPIGRLEITNTLLVRSNDFRQYTGLMTLDGLLNGKPEISLDALRHLVLPVLTISLLHWSTLSRVTRAAVVEEFGKDYILAARGRGIAERRLVWRHVLPNVFVPALNSSALSVAALVTSLFVVESIFLFNGVSSMIVTAYAEVPDISLALGFVLFSVVLVLIVTTILDILQVALDPLVRESRGVL